MGCLSKIRILTSLKLHRWNDNDIHSRTLHNAAWFFLDLDNNRQFPYGSQIKGNFRGFRYDKTQSVKIHPNTPRKLTYPLKRNHLKMKSRLPTIICSFSGGVLFTSFKNHLWIHRTSNHTWCFLDPGTPKKSDFFPAGKQYVHHLFLVVFPPTQLKNMRKSNWIMSPKRSGWKFQECLSYHHLELGESWLVNRDP